VNWQNVFFSSCLFRYFLFESFDSIFLLSSLCKVKVRFVFQWKLDDKALFRSFPPVKRLQLTAMSFKSILFSTIFFLCKKKLFTTQLLSLDTFNQRKSAKVQKYNRNCEIVVEEEWTLHVIVIPSELCQDYF